ncbi:dual specificity mitogen-activated protein kinase kinase 7 isoform X3 [Rhinatrema bivittatum]|uniref:dual specificity mitogen-activated protein kinase kinase 7 isoform X3 n=1 Tax=Rhinatrema bivittatum TaxID=194408 RepID=UPI001126DEF8|nr:dual specificity mitogen-activated protein kinase kinase 7 isoform X3 [Rhinatrema bivittatum]
MAASSLEQKLSRLEAKLKQENREARRRIDLNLEISPQRPRPTLQLPLANDGGSRASSSESSPQHPAHPPRPRTMLSLPQPSPFYVQRSIESIEIDQKLQEIMKQTGYLTIGGQRHQAEIGDLENLGEIGSGTCGQVWKMRFKKTGHIIAVKQMRRSGNKEENKRILMDLDVVLKSHDCPYIVQCFGTFITNTDVFIAMELMGTCAEKLKKRIQGPIPERILGKMTVAIVKALFYLKEKHGVIHRDVKPSNILLDERGQIKLCDFGISGRLVDSKAKTRSAGCAAYMAPERIDPPDPTKPDYDIRADVWSLGISLVELATGQFPYKNCKTDFEVLTKVLQEEPPLLPSNMGFSVHFQSFVKDCLTKDHRRRPKYNKLLEHTFIRRYETLEVDVTSWFKDVMAKTESPRTSSILSQHHLPFFTSSWLEGRLQELRSSLEDRASIYEKSDTQRKLSPCA